MKTVNVMLFVNVQLDVDNCIASNEDLLFDAINELDYSFNSYSKQVEVRDYYIPDFQILEIQP